MQNRWITVAAVLAGVLLVVLAAYVGHRAQPGDVVRDPGHPAPGQNR